MRRVPGWDSIGWLFAGFSTRLGGVSRVFAGVGDGSRGGSDLNLGFTREDDPAAVEENRRRLVEAVGGDWRLVVLRQVHGIEVREVTTATVGEAMAGGRGRWEADGVMTGEPGLLLGVGAADCVPVLVADRRQRVVGAFHAGWRGTAAGMARVGLRQMVERFGTRPADCVAAIGPSIGSCCYEVGEEVRAAFATGLAEERGAGGKRGGGKRRGEGDSDPEAGRAAGPMAAGFMGGEPTTAGGRGRGHGRGDLAGGVHGVHAGGGWATALFLAPR